MLPAAAAVLVVCLGCGSDRSPAPNVDFALAALAHLAAMRRGSSEAIFAIARVAGWLGHAIEEYASGATFRPRSIYVGVRVPER